MKEVRSRTVMGVRVRSDVADKLALWWGVAGECELGFYLSVLRKCLRIVECDGRPRGVDAVRTLLQIRQPVGNSVTVVQEEVRPIDKNRSFRRLGGDGESPQHRLGERLLYCQLFRGIAARRAESQVGLNEQHFGAASFEIDEASFRNLSAIEAEIIRAGSKWEGIYIEKLGRLSVGAEMLDLKIEFAGPGIPVKRDQSVEVFHASGFFLNGGRRGRLPGWGCRLCALRRRKNRKNE